MATTSREWRINEREYEPLTDERIIELLDDTGDDCPAMNFTAAEVYAALRELREHREAFDATTEETGT